jgi:hypothetical protein
MCRDTQDSELWEAQEHAAQQAGFTAILQAGRAIVWPDSLNS